MRSWATPCEARGDHEKARGRIPAAKTSMQSGIPGEISPVKAESSADCARPPPPIAMPRAHSIHTMEITTALRWQDHPTHFRSPKGPSQRTPRVLITWRVGRLQGDRGWAAEFPRLEQDGTGVARDGDAAGAREKTRSTGARVGQTAWIAANRRPWPTVRRSIRPARRLRNKPGRLTPSKCNLPEPPGTRFTLSWPMPDTRLATGWQMPLWRHSSPQGTAGPISIRAAGRPTVLSRTWSVEKTLKVKIFDRWSLCQNWGIVDKITMPTLLITARTITLAPIRQQSIHARTRAGHGAGGPSLSKLQGHCAFESLQGLGSCLVRWLAEKLSPGNGLNGYCITVVQKVEVMTSTGRNTTWSEEKVQSRIVGAGSLGPGSYPGLPANRTGLRS